MGRCYKKKERGRKYCSNVPKDLLEKAKTLVEKDNVSVRQAASQFGLSKSTLHDFIKKTHTGKMGGQTVLSEAVEAMIVKRIITMGEWGFPLGVLELRMLVKAYLDRRGCVVQKFQDNLPGQDWARSFLRRNKKELTTRLSTNIKHDRAKVSPTVIKEYFSHLGNTLENVPPENILNYDETNLTDDPGKKKVIVRRGVKYPERVLNATKASISVMFAGSGSGELLPPYVVYRAVHLYDLWTQGGPSGARYNRSQSGWFEATTFEDWFHKIALPYFKNLPGKKVLLGDNLSTHISPSVIETCEENNISFVLLPPNSTNLTQPLDVAVFRPLKRIWRDILLQFKQSASGRRYAALPKDHFPGLLKKLMMKLQVSVADNLKNGFRKCGIVPLDADQILCLLPDEVNEPVNAEDESASLDNSLISYLKSMRYGEDDDSTAGSSKKSGKKKRLSVPAGQSVSLEALLEDDNSSSPPKSQRVKDLRSYRKKKSKKVQREENQDNEEDLAGPSSSAEQVQEEEDQVIQEEEDRVTQKELPGPSSCAVQVPVLAHEEDIELDITPACWVLVKLFSEVKKFYRFFVAVVIKIEPELEVRFVKHIPGTKNVFVNPDNDEFSELEIEDIVRVLPDPQLDRKCRLIFDVDATLWPK